MQQTFQCSMKAETSQANDQITEETDKKDRVMCVSPATRNTAIRQVHKRKIGEGIHSFGTVLAQIVILRTGFVFSQSGLCPRSQMTYISLHLLTSSHQFKVEVTEPHTPSPAAGYGHEGRPNCILFGPSLPMSSGEASVVGDMCCVLCQEDVRCRTS